MNCLKNLSGFALSFVSLALVAGVSFNASAGGLPPGYYRVSYIQGNAKDTRVITDYVPHPPTDKIVAEVEFVRDNDEGVWCSRGQGASASAWLLFRISKKCRFDYGVSSKSTTSTTALTVNTRYTFTAADNHVAISTAEGVAEEYDVADTTAGSLTESGGPLCLFYSYHSGVRGTTTYYGNFKLYSLKVYRKNAQTEEYDLLYDLVPVQTPDYDVTLCNLTDNAITLTKEGSFSGETKTFLERLTSSEYTIDPSEAEAATGGDIIWKIGNDYMHIFTNANETATFTPVVKDLNARILLVGGGGSGGGSRGGGGGAGGMIDTNDVALTASTSYIVTVGKGGDSVSDGNFGINGGDSKLTANEASVVDAAIGGGGGGYGIANGDGKVGGSGGGGGSYTGNVGNKAPAGGSGTSGQGCDGGTGGGGYNRACAGGGGGAKSAGGAGGATSATAVEGLGVGGEGKISDILGYEDIFAGGGGGGMMEAFKSSKNGGLGGGGAGGITSSNKTAQDGENGRGGGGGGGTSGWKSGTINTTSGGGGSGIVIVRYHYTAQGEKDKIVVPLAISGLVYDGTEQQGVADGVGYTLSGHRETAAGSHTATATLVDTDNSEWADDGSTDPKSIEWSIAQAVNVWTTPAAISKTSWLVAEDTPGVLTVPVAKFGDVVATLNDAEWDGATLPTEIGNYTAVWAVEETTDFTGLSVTKTFEILPVPAPEDRNARYFDGTEWKGANSFAEAVAAAPDGGIVELNRDETSSTTIVIDKSLTIRSCSARDVRYTLQDTASVTLLEFKGEGATSVLSNLVVNVSGTANIDAPLLSLSKGALTLGDDLLLQKGTYPMGSLMVVSDNAGPLNLDGVIVSNSVAQWGLFKIGNNVTVNLRACLIQGITKWTSTAGNGTVLNMSGAGSILNVFGGTITNNEVSSASYGQVYCAGTVNFFGGKPIIQDLGVSGATNIRLDGTLDDDASVGVIYGAAAGDPFGTYVSGDRMCARAFYPTRSDNPKLRGGTRGTKLVWKTPPGLILFVR